MQHHRTTGRETNTAGAIRLWLISLVRLLLWFCGIGGVGESSSEADPQLNPQLDVRPVRAAMRARFGARAATRVRLRLRQFSQGEPARRRRRDHAPCSARRPAVRRRARMSVPALLRGGADTG